MFVCVHVLLVWHRLLHDEKDTLARFEKMVAIKAKMRAEAAAAEKTRAAKEAKAGAAYGGGSSSSISSSSFAGSDSRSVGSSVGSMADAKDVKENLMQQKRPQQHGSASTPALWLHSLSKSAHSTGPATSSNNSSSSNTLSKTTSRLAQAGRRVL